MIRLTGGARLEATLERCHSSSSSWEPTSGLGHSSRDDRGEDKLWLSPQTEQSEEPQPAENAYLEASSPRHRSHPHRGSPIMAMAMMYVLEV